MRTRWLVGLVVAAMLALAVSVATMLTVSLDATHSMASQEAPR